MPAKEKLKVEPVKFFTAVLLSGDCRREKVMKRLESEFGKIDYISPLINFNYTDYYEKEFGRKLKRVFLSFKDTINPSEIAGIKTKTIRIEEDLSVEGRRRANIDPGYMEPSKVVLASSKNFYHRIYLKKGVYAEVTLSYSGGKFRDFEWTFPDYRTDEYKKQLMTIRNIYMEKRKKLKCK